MHRICENIYYSPFFHEIIVHCLDDSGKEYEFDRRGEITIWGYSTRNPRYKS
jgi:hypothetical protein